MKTNWQVAINRMEFHRRFSRALFFYAVEEEESRYRKRIKFHGRLGWNVKTARPRFASTSSSSRS